jgi:hypothetical protein
MTAIMPIDEPRPRGTCMGTRADARPVCTENLIQVDAVMESPKLAE